VPIVLLTFYLLGGVFNRPAAAIYWEERFGDLFSGGLDNLKEIQLQVELGNMLCIDFKFI
jgi:hypothetical protein